VEQKIHAVDEDFPVKEMTRHEDDAFAGVEIFVSELRIVAMNGLQDIVFGDGHTFKRL